MIYCLDGSPLAEGLKNNKFKDYCHFTNLAFLIGVF
jgi:hypothetical protein